MVRAKLGDRVRVHYTARLERGVIVDTSEGGEPFEFVLGEGKVLPGFEEAVIGMSPGDVRTVRIPPEKGYGPYRQDLEVEVERSRLPADLNIGETLEIVEDDGRVIKVEIMDIIGDKVVLNANHPLAGVDLIYEIRLLEIL
ncbi:FKBP-type peptidyl-prolyl cis-trans isomerase [Methanothrix sp.]|uniref:FKBP-type peptidyl-prolyl cis-trans isomerase n=1 Tax=Methanothrix sp. TaxID=90426 RepID=UPI002B628D54|nr:FKBP-type peptidyl-prolyl cis-trans isomerase [Methanothrix sp.]HOK57484.1 FKBP-type peptidyl-prolyl cis-trans isomerase [Methanothrix sp.]HOL42661.1 FKBP-type peptidyl-prolyl cis-trans isomerase [Methanothrix sp.]HPO87769.1 FKBP-type peptidyl-prolyl cis-trans isomerase [Methanothrix sp.]